MCEGTSARPCADCGTPVERRAAKGPFPKRCPTCKARHERAKDAAAHRAARAEGRPAGPESLTCDDCRDTFARKSRNGPPARRCDDCAYRRGYQAENARVAQRKAAKFENAGRWAKCETCGVALRLARKGPQQKRCVPCRKRRRADVRRRKRERNNPPAELRCGDCNASLPRPVGRGKAPTYCTRCAQRRRHQHVRNYQLAKRQTTVEPFNDLEIFKRDGWICQIGHHPVDPDLKYPDAGSATIDHIMPLTYGGTHTRDNVRLACFGCNRTRAHRFSDADLELLGLTREEAAALPRAY